MAIVGSFTVFCACSNEDEPDGGKKGTAIVTLDGENLNLKYAYYSVYEGNVMIQFSNYDITSGKYPDNVIFVLIDYQVEAGQKDIQNATIKSGNYNFTIEKHDGPEDSGTDAFYDSKPHDASNADLVVEKNGKNIKLSIDKITFVQTTANGKPIGEVSGSFYYNGAIKKLSY